MKTTTKDQFLRFSVNRWQVSTDNCMLRWILLLQRIYKIHFNKKTFFVSARGATYNVAELLTFIVNWFFFASNVYMNMVVKLNSKWRYANTSQRR